jgi:hypothetical protein
MSLAEHLDEEIQQPLMTLECSTKSGTAFTIPSSSSQVASVGLGRHAEPHSNRPSVAGYDGLDGGHPPASGAFGPRPHMYNARFRRTTYSASGFVLPLPLSRSMTASNDRSRRLGDRAASAAASAAAISSRVMSVQ